MQASSRLSFWQKKLRSFIKRSFIPLVSQSDSYMIQQLPEWIDRKTFDFTSFRKIWTAQNPKNDTADMFRLCLLIENIQQLQKEQIEGAIAELGVYKGTTAKIFHTMMPEKELYLFDTFEGFDERDFAHEVKNTKNSFQFADTSLENVMQFVGSSSNIHYCKGYFPATVHYIPEDKRFALVHLDADLYKPTLDALEFFYPKMTPGGLIILHDYGSLAWPGIAQAVDAFFLDKPESLIRLSDKSGTVMVRKIKPLSSKKEGLESV